jgi:hypothetical protein
MIDVGPGRRHADSHPAGWARATTTPIRRRPRGPTDPGQDSNNASVDGGSHPASSAAFILHLTVGDVALVSNTATLTRATPDGSPVCSTTTEILRRQADGGWAHVVDDPFFS